MSENRTVPLECGWNSILSDSGIQSENVFRRANLPVELMGLDNALLTGEEYVRLWTALEDESGDPLLPLNIILSAKFETFHPAVFAALCSPDLSIAAERLATYKRLIGPMRMNLRNNTNGLFINIQWDDPKIDMIASHATMELVMIVQLVRHATKENIVPVKVDSRFPIEQVDAYTDYFGTEPVLGSTQGVTFSQEDAKRPFLVADDSLWHSFKPNLQRRLSELEAALSTTERLRFVLLECIPSGQVAIGYVANRLGVSSRTLQRRLQLENSSYKEIIRQTREDLARHYLEDTTLPYTEISFLLGFEESSSFFRAFREWTGKTPESVRVETSGS